MKDRKRLRLPIAMHAAARSADDSAVLRLAQEQGWREHVVVPEVSGMPRPISIFLAERKTKVIKWDWHGDKATFCPPLWADLAIGSGACGFGCRACFLMLTFRARRDPLRPVVYTNGDRFESVARRWLRAREWSVYYETRDSRGKRTRRPRRVRRTPRQSIGLGIDCADSLLFEGITGHARRLIPIFADSGANPQGNSLVLLTKSANVHYLDELAPSRFHDRSGTIPNVVVSMSLNPEPIADLWEGKYPDTLERMTPPISRRLEALRWAQDLGFEVRARVDPILPVADWEDLYAEFFQQMAFRHGLRPTMLTLGTYREKNAHLEIWRAKWGLPAMEYEPNRTQGRQGTHVHLSDRAHVYARTKEIIRTAFAGSGWSPAVSLCKETHDVRKQVDLCNADCNCLRAGLGR